jgi:hypothetical protein
MMLKTGGDRIRLPLAVTIPLPEVAIGIVQTTRYTIGDEI